MKNQNYKGYLFILPFFLVFGIFQLYPLIYTLFLSFTKYNGLATPRFIGLANYINLLKDKFFWQAFFNTWIIWLPNIILQITLALLVGVLFTNYHMRIGMAGFFRAVFYFPNLVTAASIALLFNVLLDWQNGSINQLLFGAHKESYLNWMNQPLTAQMVISIIQTWMWFGYTMIVFTAGLNGIPRSYYEAAAIDGAGAVESFFRITLPLLQPIIVFVIITSLIGGMQIFDIPHVMTNGDGKPGNALTTAVMYLYKTGFRYERFGYASAVSYMLFFLIMIFSLIYLKVIDAGTKGEKS